MTLNRLWRLGALSAIYYGVLLAVYLADFGAPLQYDSVAFLRSHEPSFHLGLSTTLKLFPQRPVPIVTFYLNYLLTRMDPLFFRLVNALFYAVLAAAMVALLVLLLEAPECKISGSSVEKRLVSVGLGFLFLLHPAGVFVIFYVWQRITLLAALSFVLSLLAYMAVRTGKIGPVSGYGMAALFFCIGMASKETTVTLPVVLVLAEIAFFRTRMRDLIPRGAVLAVVVLLAVMTLSRMERPHGHEEAAGVLETLARYYKESGLTVGEVVLGQCGVTFKYLRMILVPVPRYVHLLAAQVVPSSVSSPWTTLAAVVGIALLVGLGLWLLSRRPWVGFGILFYLGNLVPEALLVPQYLFCGYRVILPMIGLVFIVADGLFWITEGVQSAPYRRVLTGCFLLSCVLGGVFLHQTAGAKVALWKSSYDWWLDVKERLPADARAEKHIRIQALDNLGYWLQQRGDLTAAIALEQQALKLDDGVPYTYLVLGSAYRQARRLEEAVATYRALLSVRPDSPQGYGALGAVLIDLHRYDEAAVNCRKAIQLDPFNPDDYFALAIVALSKRDYPLARTELEQTLALNPDHRPARFNLEKLEAALAPK